MLYKQNFNTITEADLTTLNSFVSTPLIMFNCEKIEYINDYCRLLFEYSHDYTKPVSTKNFFEDNNFIEEIKGVLENSISLKLTETYITTTNYKKLFVKLDYRVVIYNSEKYILAHLYDITSRVNDQKKLVKFSAIRSLMLEVSQSIVKIDNIEQIYQLILNNVISALEKAKIGTIFVKEDDLFKVVAHSGFTSEIMGFKLKSEDVFLYRATNGKMDTIENIGDLMTISSYVPIKTKLGEKDYIKSTISAPININGELYGTINIDSVELNAFDEDDIKYMTFIKNCIEVAISNFILYNEQIYLAKHDSLTKLYNRFYIEDRFEKCKEEAIAKEEVFYLVIFDIDNLKQINDNYGHSVGDLAILKIVNELNKITNKKDCLARVGGDEFLGIYYEKDENSLINKVHNSLNNINNMMEVDFNHIACSFSYGVSTFGKDGYTFKKLFKVADDKMYMTKKYKIN